MIGTNIIEKNKELVEHHKNYLDKLNQSLTK